MYLQFPDWVSEIERRLQSGPCGLWCPSCQSHFSVAEYSVGMICESVLIHVLWEFHHHCWDHYPIQRVVTIYKVAAFEGALNSHQFLKLHPIFPPQGRPRRSRRRVPGNEKVHVLLSNAIYVDTVPIPDEYVGNVLGVTFRPTARPGQKF